MFMKELKVIENYFLNKSESFSNVQSAVIKACEEEGSIRVTYQQGQNNSNLSEKTPNSSSVAFLSVNHESDSQSSNFEL